MPEVGLGIGRVQGQQDGIAREWLAWHDKAGNVYPLPSELLRRERLRADQEQLRAVQLDQALQHERREKQQLLEKLQRLGIDPDQL